MTQSYSIGSQAHLGEVRLVESDDCLSVLARVYYQALVASFTCEDLNV